MTALMLLGVTAGSIGASAAQAQRTPATALAAAPAQPPANDWQPDPDDQWLFELRTERYRVGDGVRGYARGAQTCVNLADIIVALDLPIRVDTQLRRATGWVFYERRTLTVDRESGRVTIASQSAPLAHGAIVDTPEGWCVDPVLLGQWLGVDLSADLSNSVLMLRSTTPMPFEQAAQRRARAAAIRPQTTFNLADLPHAQRPYAMWQAPSVDVAASTAIIRDARTGATSGQLRYEMFASGEALTASFDARLSSSSNGTPESLRVRAYRSDPSGQLLGRFAATHAAVGDVGSFSTPIGAQPVMGRGAVMTNRPLDLPDSFDRTTFRGDLPAGWDAELYRNGQLLAFASPGADGRYEFANVQLSYGINRFEIILYGPQGQERREIHNIPVGVDAIPPGKNYYWAGIVQEGRDLLRLTGDNQPYRRGWRGTFGFERGLNRRTSIGACATTMVIDAQRYTIGEAALRRSIGPTFVELTGSVQDGGATAARLFWAGELGQGFFQLESLNGWQGYRSDRLTQGVRGLHSLSVDQTIRAGTMVLPIHAEARYRQNSNGAQRFELVTRSSANWRNLSMTGQVEWQHSTASRTSVAVGDDVFASLLANARFGRLRVRGEARVNISGPTNDDRVAMVAEWTQSERTDWRAELGYESAARRARIGMGYTRRFARLALSGYGEAATDGSVAAGLSLSFGLGPNPQHGGVRVSRERLATQGQALATVFYDENGDGVQQADEERAQSIVLTAGNAVADMPTDANGLAIVDTLAPFRPILIGIDESSLPSPLVRAAVPGIVITPRPGVATIVQLPLVAAGEVEGILARSGGTGIEGVDLELVDARGVVRATVRTDFDGFFLFESVPYGRYTLRANALSAQAAGITATLGQAELGRAQPRVRMGLLNIVARSDLAQTTPVAPAAPATATVTMGAR
ncbi:MAG: carboxypeptidase regulatory-like domain-containing protein [Sphingopyxis sp.]